MRIVAHFEVLETVVKEAVRAAQDVQRGVGVGSARELQFHLLEVVAVDVAVAACPDEVAHVQIALLRHHVGQQRVAGDVEGHAQEDVGAALVQLAAQPAPLSGGLRRCHVELEERVAGHEGHLVQVGHVPGAHDDAARVGVGPERFDHLADLVDMAAVRRGPATPLHAIDRAQVAILAGPFVPDGDAALLQPVVAAGAGEEPEQFRDDGLEMDLLGGDQRKALVQVEPHLVAEHAAGAGASAVALGHAMGIDVAHEVFVLGAYGAGGGIHGQQAQTLSQLWSRGF